MSETSESNKPVGEAEPQSTESAVESTEARKGSQPDPGGDSPSTEGAPEPSPLEKAQAEINKLKDSWIRTAADFDNFRKRSRKEVEDARKQGGEELLRELLPVFDNLERGIQSAQRAQDVKAVAEGLTMVHKQFDSTLSRMGVTKVPTVGHPFDPAVHEAIQQVETDEHPPGTIVSEVQAGYLNGDRLVRAAMVVVAKAKAGGGEDVGKGESN